MNKRYLNPAGKLSSRPILYPPKAWVEEGRKILDVTFILGFSEQVFALNHRLLWSVGAMISIE
ncbi:hypothetical protein [Photorhabdus bodei]|uniref:Uncharacterized protein n=1 Tax=Photorhabdus bodei TaxID=2029681 RepID=A0A329X350_9GAMM|nr:hypothetical protein [Photorhabdus bodei]NDL00140.1 hypothetical protein [Photorhabdus bodei]NDL04275.1 hypothetical protein [Photorhabdus bodei]NDL08556.1 hypothetical protein [Photorhabdus bodei]RAX10042.1 hypothetical protein CKY02_15975 [Photorhabdus bodei]